MKKVKGKHLDFSQIAHAIVELATDEKDQPEEPITKNPAAVALGRLGGLKGGPARSKKLSAKKRKEIAQKAAKVRWSERKNK
jgi:hypothetical protein